MTQDDCWSCSYLSVTVGGFHCFEHNIFLHEQTKPEDIGSGGDGCNKFKHREVVPVIMGVDMANGDDISVSYKVKNGKIYPAPPIRYINIKVRFE